MRHSQGVNLLAIVVLPLCAAAAAHDAGATEDALIVHPRLGDAYRLRPAADQPGADVIVKAPRQFHVNAAGRAVWLDAQGQWFAGSVAAPEKAAKVTAPVAAGEEVTSAMPSHDGRRIGWATRVGDKFAAGQNRLIITDAASGAILFLDERPRAAEGRRDPAFSRPAWSRDDRHVAYLYAVPRAEPLRDTPTALLLHVDLANRPPKARPVRGGPFPCATPGWESRRLYFVDPGQIAFPRIERPRGADLDVDNDTAMTDLAGEKDVRFFGPDVEHMRDETHFVSGGRAAPAGPGKVRSTATMTNVRDQSTRRITVTIPDAGTPIHWSVDGRYIAYFSLGGAGRAAQIRWYAVETATDKLIELGTTPRQWMETEVDWVQY